MSALKVVMQLQCYLQRVTTFLPCLEHNQSENLCTQIFYSALQYQQ